MYCMHAGTDGTDTKSPSPPPQLPSAENQLRSNPPPSLHAPLFDPTHTRGGLSQRGAKGEEKGGAGRGVAVARAVALLQKGPAVLLKQRNLGVQTEEDVRAEQHQLSTSRQEVSQLRVQLSELQDEAYGLAVQMASLHGRLQAEEAEHQEARECCARAVAERTEVLARLEGVQAEGQMVQGQNEVQLEQQAAAAVRAAELHARQRIVELEEQFAQVCMMFACTHACHTHTRA